MRKRWRLIAVVMMLVPFACPATAQENVKWTARLEPSDVRAGESAQIVVTATIQAPWHTYSVNTPANGPVATSFEMSDNKSLVANGKPVEPKGEKIHDAGFNMDLVVFEGTVAFGQPVKLNAGIKGKQKTTIKVHWMVCNSKNCMPPDTVEVPIAFKVSSGPARANRVKPVTTVPKQPGTEKKRAENNSNATSGTVVSGGSPPAPISSAGGFTDDVEQAKRKGLLAFLLLAFSAGFGALLTPCVFPMVPITVSFFTKKRDNANTQGIGGPIAFCLGIIFTFAGLGILMTALFGASGIQRFATNPWVNLGMASLFIALAANLFGVFEIAMPAWLINTAQTGTKKGGYTGPLLMGLTFTLTSFTCTVPFVGTLLVTAARGGILYPLLGMLAFSTAFALPFFLLALFPQALGKLPRSGSWLVSVKGYMGFLELAAALKFLSNSDLVWSKGILTRPVFLAIWTTISFIAAFYLLGWLRLPHDTDGFKVGWIRRMFGAGTVVLGCFCLAGIHGVSLSTFNSYLPPDPYPGSKTIWLASYADALTKAKAENKPVFIDFTGITCTNCRLMEDNVFPVAKVKSELGNFVLARLYTDYGNAENVANQELQKRLVNTVALPYYVVVSPQGKLLSSYQGLTYNIEEFVEFLQKAHSVKSDVAVR